MSNRDTGGVILATIFVTPFVIGLAAVAGAYQVFAEGYCASLLWTWFAVPLGLRAITWVTFAGASCLLAITRIRLSKAERKDDRETSEKVVAWLGYLAAPWLILMVAWCIK